MSVVLEVDPTRKLRARAISDLPVTCEIYAQPYALSKNKRSIIVGRTDGALGVHVCKEIRQNDSNSVTLEFIQRGSIAVSVAKGEMNTFDFYQWDEKEPVKLIRAHDRGISAIVSGQIDHRFVIFSGSVDGSLRIWDGKTLELVVQLSGGSISEGISSLALSEIEAGQF
jgi:WD40 repeat protein